MDPESDKISHKSLLSQLDSEFEFSDFEEKQSNFTAEPDDEDDYETDFDAEEIKSLKKSLSTLKPLNRLDQAIRDINDKLDNLRNWNDLVTKDGIGLHQALVDIGTMDQRTLLEQKQDIHDHAALFQSTTNAMVNTCAEFLKSTQTDKWADIIQHQAEQREELQGIVEFLAKQQHRLTKKAAAKQIISLPTATPNAPPDLLPTKKDEKDDQYFDATEIVWSDIILQPGTIGISESRYITQIQKRYTDAVGSLLPSPSEASLLRLTHKNFNDPDFPDSDTNSVLHVTKKERRTRIAVKPLLPLNLWSFLKNCLGKDLAHVPMPVNFNEPLSMLQRLTENFEYAYLLDMAANCENECEQLAYVAAFSVSNYSSTADRIAKPFNPLLGETYECDRTDDFGWRCISEQVSHHPPISMLFCEGYKWVCYQEFTMRSKFRVKYLQVLPTGNTIVEFKNTGHKYVWQKVTTTIHNIVVGKIWVDQEGESEIIGLKAAQGLKCLVEYIPYSYFSKTQQRCVKGTIINREGEVPMLLRGSWDREIGILPVISHTGKGPNLSYVTGDYTAIWTRSKAPPDNEKIYNFTTFTCQLNEWEDYVAPTDSRRRPDQRLMEDGLWDESNLEKSRLEEKQRVARRKTEAENRHLTENPSESNVNTMLSGYLPVWFSLIPEEDTNVMMFVYNGTYWKAKEKQDWSQCPDIYS